MVFGMGEATKKNKTEGKFFKKKQNKIYFYIWKKKTFWKKILDKMNQPKEFFFQKENKLTLIKCNADGIRKQVVEATCKQFRM